jgi:hypothetical protein
MQPDNLAWVHFAQSSGQPVAAGCGDSQLLPAPNEQTKLAKGCVKQAASKAKTWLQSLFN